MKEGIWLCNMSVEDYNRLKPIYEPLQEIQVGPPAATARYTVEDLERMGLIGLYTTANTSMRTFDSLSINHRKHRKKMTKDSVVEIFDDEEFVFADEVVRSEEDNHDVNLFDFLDD